MRQMDLELGEVPGERRAVPELQGRLREEVAELIAKAIVAVVRSVKEREGSDERSAES